MTIGAHVSAAISLDLCFRRAQDIGASCFQFFISPPQQWIQSKHSEEEINRYKLKQVETGIGPNFIHGTYLINLGTQDPVHLQKSIDWLSYAMDMAGKLGVEGVIFHLGSHKGLGFDGVIKQIVNSLIVTLNASEGYKTPYLILENSAGAGGNIGSKFPELGSIIKSVNNPRLKIALDTCHAFAAGYDLKTKDGLKKVLDEFDKEIGLEHLAVIHANDTKWGIGSGKDRHENIGDGFLGKDGFKNMINNPKLKNIPFILEVPGFAGTGPDKENIDILKGLDRH